MTHAPYAAAEIACLGKDKLSSMNQAREVAQRMTRRYVNRGVVNAYRCKYCGFYHVGEKHRKGTFYGKPKP